MITEEAFTIGERLFRFMEKHPQQNLKTLSATFFECPLTIFAV